MKTIFSTTDVHPRDRYIFWRDVACKTILDHESETESPQSFEAELRAGKLADLDVVTFSNSSLTVTQTMRHAARADADHFFVCRQLAGSFRLDQDSHEVDLQPGDITLFDPRLPFTGHYSGNSRLLVFKVPRRLIEARIGQANRLIACTIDLKQAANAITSEFLALLPTYVEFLASPAAEVVREQMLDLVGLSLATVTPGQNARVSSARSIVLLKVRSVIEARLGDLDLDAEAVAAAAGVSVRYANSVLADENSSVMRHIQARRLARCRLALEDPAQRHRTVREIAYSWGFSDMTHFGRRFRAAYGMLPSEMRDAASSLAPRRSGYSGEPLLRVVPNSAMPLRR